MQHQDSIPQWMSLILFNVGLISAIWREQYLLYTFAQLVLANTLVKLIVRSVLSQDQNGLFSQSAIVNLKLELQQWIDILAIDNSTSTGTQFINTLLFLCISCILPFRLDQLLILNLLFVSLTMRPQFNKFIAGANDLIRFVRDKVPKVMA